MPTDLLSLGGIVFDDWSTPSEMPFGGNQALKIHKLPGGSRVIDILGPDEMDIAFRGILWGPDADVRAGALNALRISGSPIGLAFGGNFYQVIVQKCTLTIHRYPQWYEYDITCVVSSNPMAGSLSSAVSSFSSLVSADLASALSIAGL